MSPSATLGQVLDVTVPVRTEAGERFGADCVQVDVRFGELRLLSTQIRTSVEPGAVPGDWRVHVVTTEPVQEPVVEVGLSAGCERRFTRRFTAFADPPSLVSPSLAVIRPETASTVAAVAPAGEGQAGGLAPESGARAPHGKGAAGSGHRSRVAKGPTRAAAAAANRAAQAKARGAAGAETSGTAAGPAGASRLLLDTGYARLKLDMEDPVIPVTSVAAAGSGAAITLSDLDIDSDARRLQQLEQTLQALKKETQASRSRNEALQARLNEAESRSERMPWLLGLLGLFALGLAALGWKLRSQARDAHSAWFQESQRAELAAAPAAPLTGAQAAAASVRVASPAKSDPAAPSIVGVLEDDADNASPAEDAGASGEPMSATQPLTRAALAAAMAQAETPAAAARELSVEELLDLEQQADFFIALGQEDAAVDLLMSHLRSAGGQSPLPYTKLLEIYRRQGDRSAYERTRARFNRRFNAYAPDWDAGPASGQHLEDYPEAIAQIQSVWDSPLDAMAVLEALLFRRDDARELFDLPAYRDVLVLYSLARDLWTQSGSAATSTHVDVLLPLDDIEDEPAISHFAVDLHAVEGDAGVHATLDSHHLGPRAIHADAPHDERAEPDGPRASNG